MQNLKFCNSIFSVKSALFVTNWALHGKIILLKEFYHEIFYHKKKVFITFFDLEAKEEEKIEKFLQFLEDSGVGSVINKYALKRPKFKASPYELTVNLLGEEIVKKLGVEFVDPNDITFSPKFFK